MKRHHIILILLILALGANWTTIKLHFMMYIIIRRGLIAPNCRWWSISNVLLHDTVGIHLFNQLKQRYGDYIPIHLINRNMYILTNMDDIRFALDHSPTIFGAGSLKKDFFSTFMPTNVGISEGCPWIQRRVFNECVLDTHHPPRFMNNYIHWFRTYLNDNAPPTTFDTYQSLALDYASHIVFQHPIPHPFFALFQDANTIQSFLSGNIDLDLSEQFYTYLDHLIDHPRPYSLIAMIQQCPSLQRNVILDQIPHWIFPLVSIVAILVPRTLVLIHASGMDTDSLIQDPYRIRQCLLETLRLNVFVVTLFRKLLTPVSFDGKYTFPQDTEFVVFTAPICRSSYFSHPSAFIPDRWTPALERNTHSLMFSQGPQECPGKDLSLSLATIIITELCSRYTIKDVYPHIDPMNVPDLINPCTINIQWIL